MDNAVRTILEAHEAKRPGTPARAVAERALDLGFELVPPAPGSGATYLRLVHRSLAGRPVTLYLDATELSSVARGQRPFAESLAQAVPGAKEVRYPFGSAEPFDVLAAFARWSETAETPVPRPRDGVPSPCPPLRSRPPMHVPHGEGRSSPVSPWWSCCS